MAVGHRFCLRGLFLQIYENLIFSHPARLPPASPSGRDGQGGGGFPLFLRGVSAAADGVFEKGN